MSHDPLPPVSAAEPRVPFVIGITGNVDPEGYAHRPAVEGEAVESLRAKIRAVFAWVRAESGYLDPVTGRFHEDTPPPSGLEIWAALGLTHTPIVVLSALAPGADTLVAEEALRADGEISLRAPLPFPLDLNWQSSTFQEKDAVVPTQTPQTERFQALVQQLKAQAGFVAERDLFAVAVDNDLDGDPAVHLVDEKQRKIRYRATGEYVATHSDLLLAIYDQRDPESNPDDYTSCGTRTIVETKRLGLSYELLALTNNFAWADNGPVLRIPIRRLKYADQPSPGDLPLQILHPYDTMPGAAQGGELDDQDPKWQQHGNDIFRKVIACQNAFNRLPPHREEGGELKKMLAAAPLSPQAEAFAAGLDGIARLRRRAAAESRKLEASRKSLLRFMLIGIFFVVLLLGAYEHWEGRVEEPTAASAPAHSAHELPDTAIDIVQCALVGLGLLGLGIIACKYHRHQKGENEKYRFDCRAVGEGLRVQFFWLLTGQGMSVSADYMQRHRSELDWIRYLISSAAFPFVERWRAGFQTLDRESKHQLLSAAFTGWVQEQRKYFAKEAPKNEHALHRCHGRGWAFIAAGVLSIVGHFITELFQTAEEMLHHHGWEVAAVMLGIGVGCVWWGRRQERAAGHHVHRRVVVWLFGNGQLWGWGLILAAVVLLGAWWLGELPVAWPGFHNWWLILTSAVLLCGGLYLAWGERNFYAENHRTYSSMRDLYGCAERRLQPLLRRYAAAPDEPAAQRILQEIQFIYHQLGCEALDENAEWLILHRTRPLEPFMAG